MLQGPHLQGHLDPSARAAYEAHGAARREYLDRGTEGRGDARRFKAPLGPTPAREASDLVDQLRVCGVDGVRRPQTAGERQAVVEHVDRDDRVAARQLRGEQARTADGPRAKRHVGVTGLRLEHVHHRASARVYPAREGCQDVERHIVRHPDRIARCGNCEAGKRGLLEKRAVDGLLAPAEAKRGAIRAIAALLQQGRVAAVGLEARVDTPDRRRTMGSP